MDEEKRLEELMKQTEELENEERMLKARGEAAELSLTCIMAASLKVESMIPDDCPEKIESQQVAEDARILYQALGSEHRLWAMEQNARDLSLLSSEELEAYCEQVTQAFAAKTVAGDGKRSGSKVGRVDGEKSA